MCFHMKRHTKEYLYGHIFVYVVCSIRLLLKPPEIFGNFTLKKYPFAPPHSKEKKVNFTNVCNKYTNNSNFLHECII